MSVHADLWGAVKRCWHRNWPLIVAVISLPGCFYGFLFGWFAMERFHGEREVAAFIEQHRQLVADRLADPKVHSFRLSKNPERPWELVIEFDVDDKETYERLEEDLDAHWHLRFPASWATHFRSDEELGENFGFHAQGIGLVVQIMGLINFASLLSCSVCSIFICYDTWRKPRMRPRLARRRPCSPPR